MCLVTTEDRLSHTEDSVNRLQGDVVGIKHKITVVEKDLFNSQKIVKSVIFQS